RNLGLAAESHVQDVGDTLVNNEVVALLLPLTAIHATEVFAAGENPLLGEEDAGRSNVEKFVSDRFAQFALEICLHGYAPWLLKTPRRTHARRRRMPAWKAPIGRRS